MVDLNVSTPHWLIMGPPKVITAFDDWASGREKGKLKETCVFRESRDSAKLFRLNMACNQVIML